MKFKIVPFLFMLALPLLLSFFISIVIPDYGAYYDSLKKPINLPSIVFPIVWSAIYVMIGVASYLVLMRKGVGFDLKVYFVDLFFNVTWSLFFFGFQNLLVSLIWTYLLLIVVIFNAYRFYRVYKWAGILFIPYVIWTVFATYLTTSIYLLNR